MAIAAIIEAVTVIAPRSCLVCEGSGKDPRDKWDDCPACYGATAENPRVRLKLGPIEEGGVPGQSVLTIVNPPTTDPQVLAALVGTKIWGCGSEIMIGEKKWANRLSYTRIELV